MSCGRPSRRVQLQINAASDELHEQRRITTICSIPAAFTSNRSLPKATRDGPPWPRRRGAMEPGARFAVWDADSQPGQASFRARVEDAVVVEASGSGQWGRGEHESSAGKPNNNNNTYITCRLRQTAPGRIGRDIDRVKNPASSAPLRMQRSPEEPPCRGQHHSAIMTPKHLSPMGPSLNTTSNSRSCANLSRQLILIVCTQRGHPPDKNQSKSSCRHLPGRGFFLLISSRSFWSGRAARSWWRRPNIKRYL